MSIAETLTVAVVVLLFVIAVIGIINLNVRRRLMGSGANSAAQNSAAQNSAAQDSAAQDSAAQDSAAQMQQALLAAMATLQLQVGHERDSAAADLSAKKDIIDVRLGQIQTDVRSELDRLVTVVGQLGESTSQRFGQVDQSLRNHVEITQRLSLTTQSLREALASPNSRGQWGERMAEDIIRSAGLIEHKQYLKRTAVVGDAQGIPDFTFLLPKGHVLFMDVKFPMAAYLRYLDATTDSDRSLHRATFLRDVRFRVKELARREYAQADTRPTIDNVLLFVPNETLSAFIHETDPDLIDEAMNQHVVICSPLTLFAFLGVIRQAFDNFMIEQTSHEMLQMLGAFAQQWGKYTESVDKVKRQFDSVANSFHELSTTRRRALERPLKDLEALRRNRGVAVDGELFGSDVLELEGSPEPDV